MNRLYRKTITYVFSKDFFLLVTVLAIMSPIFWYMLWASHLSHNTILIETFPEFTIYITTGAILGLIFAGRATYFRPVNKTPKYILEMFLGGFALGFVSILNIFDVYIYLFPDKVINYTSEYEVVFPGPYRGKYGRCEAGIWIKDAYTDRWKQLCTSKEALFKKRKQGMNEVWVTVRVNELGSYIVDYKFTYK
ncbi:hypothetical protein [Brenneria tiliae]|uniref:Uncharacterized protein n=1 Tax=Brenneria tiliae TaxID=2914984 RepID=A0ABT0MU45_9GAMM|nr:hypothetical protein [Brenneria tiliae]MCL2893132.1 hypothetical protein [Brenneria tiliae]